jgi:hypothetical protein
MPANFPGAASARLAAATLVLAAPPDDMTLPADDADAARSKGIVGMLGYPSEAYQSKSRANPDYLRLLIYNRQIDIDAPGRHHPRQAKIAPVMAGSCRLRRANRKGQNRSALKRFAGQLKSLNSLRQILSRTA